ncbi:MAG TPA: coenzyme F420-0:L-glutamate ligase [Polyangiaceae bacterium]|jgi:coenzyme F420-0:L-glutamate ligase/coenzyme F420-1:gamma-L-glutamate ligase|nr:coenzyme F420-0:L-glutamate ligase [Polyangiaceae bacterium]
MKVELFAIEGLPDVVPGDDIAALVALGIRRLGERLEPGDIVVITQKIVSKAEGRLIPLAEVEPSAFAVQWGTASGTDPRVVELVLRESRRIVRMDRGVIIVETHQGLVCANAGVDLSNVAGGEVATLLPVDPDASARRIRAGLHASAGVEVPVIISDTFGRPWREGLVNVAIGVAGLSPLRSYVGSRDPQGFPLQATIEALADEVGAAAGLVSSKLNRTPAVLVRGILYEAGDGSARDLMRAPERDMFR